MKNRIDVKMAIELYKSGESLNTIATKCGSYPTSIRRVLMRNGIDLRHDVSTKGDLKVKDGEKLIEWAKAQGRLVTKSELAAVLGKQRLSPSYFEKYPELGQYIVTRSQHDLKDYSNALYTWLKNNNIPYKPNDRTSLNISMTALLFGEYKNTVLYINVKPTFISKKYHADKTMEIEKRAKEKGLRVIFLDKTYFEDDDSLNKLLDVLKCETK